MQRAKLEQRIIDLGVRVADRLNGEQRTWFAEFVEAGEHGLALEMLADWLSEGDCAVSAGERAEFSSLAGAMGNSARVLGPIALCPQPR